MLVFPRRSPAVLACALFVAGTACHATVDSIGHDDTQAVSGGGADNAGGSGGAEDPPATLLPLTGPSSYPNAFRDVLGKSDPEIASKINMLFERLFNGNPETEAIYYPFDADSAYIRDVFHGDIRTEGIGFAMLITVELDKPDVFDHLWTYAKTVLRSPSGATAGYFQSSCDTSAGTTACFDPFGMQQFAMALIFAHGRWKHTRAMDYEADALELLRLMRHKEEDNGGVQDGVTDMFDAETQLVFDVPNLSAAAYTRPSVEMPGYYELWAQATGDVFWREAAASARDYLARVAHPTTGLTPVRAYFDGTPVPQWNMFGPEAYRTQLNMTLDRVWTGGNSWVLDESDRLLRFFLAQGIDVYGTSYTLEGEPIEPNREFALVVVNGVTALVATLDERQDFIQAVWDLEPPMGLNRYYTGILDLLALLVLSGQLRVY